MVKRCLCLHPAHTHTPFFFFFLNDRRSICSEREGEKKGEAIFFVLFKENSAVCLQPPRWCFWVKILLTHDGKLF